MIVEEGSGSIGNTEEAAMNSDHSFHPIPEADGYSDWISFLTRLGIFIMGFGGHRSKRKFREDRREKTRLILTLVISTMILVFPPWSALAEGSGAKIFLPETVWEFGRIPEGSVVSHVYPIKSIGTDTLKITEVKTSCGCAKALLSKWVIAPGDSAEIEFIFAAGWYEGEEVKSATISSNDTSLNPVKIYAGGKLVVNISYSLPAAISPSRIDFGNTEEGNDDNRKLQIRNMSLADITVDVLDYPRDWVELDDSRMVIKPGDMQELDITLKEDKKGAGFYKSVTLEIKGAKKFRFTIPLLRKILPKP
jgi:hypothetical protein